MLCRISSCYNFGLRQEEGKADKVRALCARVCVSVFEDSGWDDLERGPNIQRNRPFLIMQSHDFMTERAAHLLVALTLKQVMGRLSFFQPYSTRVLPYYILHTCMYWHISP